MMGRDSDDELFQGAIEGIQPIEQKASRPRRRPRKSGVAADALPVRFEIERAGEVVRAAAPGAGEEALWKLERGQIEPLQTLDLHGRNLVEARRAVTSLVRRAARAKQRCVCIVHGRGLRSEGGPVLKSALPDWLAAPAIGELIEGFCSAPPEMGSTGATLVLLWQR